MSLSQSDAGLWVWFCRNYLFPFCVKCKWFVVAPSFLFKGHLAHEHLHSLLFSTGLATFYANQVPDKRNTTTTNLSEQGISSLRSIGCAVKSSSLISLVVRLKD